MSDIEAAIARLARQEQFLEVVSSEEATRRFHRHLALRPLAGEVLPLSQPLNRVLAEAVVAEVDVPGFDRANVDGFALRASDVADASEQAPRRLQLNLEVLTPGTPPLLPVAPGFASLIATGGMLPRGADAVVMIEHTEAREIEGKTVSVVLDEFIAKRGDKLIADPAKRALLPRDLWVLFDAVAPPRAALRDEMPHRVELTQRLAKILPRLALTADQIKKLPDNFAEAVAAKKFPDWFDVGRLWAADVEGALLEINLVKRRRTADAQRMGSRISRRPRQTGGKLFPALEIIGLRHNQACVGQGQFGRAIGSGEPGDQTLLRTHGIEIGRELGAVVPVDLAYRRFVAGHVGSGKVARQPLESFGCDLHVEFGERL